MPSQIDELQRREAELKQLDQLDQPEDPCQPSLLGSTKNGTTTDGSLDFRADVSDDSADELDEAIAMETGM